MRGNLVRRDDGEEEAKGGQIPKFSLLGFLVIIFLFGISLYHLFSLKLPKKWPKFHEIQN